MLVCANLYIIPVTDQWDIWSSGAKTLNFWDHLRDAQHHVCNKKEKEMENSIPHSSRFADKSNIKWCTSGLPTLRPPFQSIKFELPAIYLTSVALSSYAATLRHNTRSTAGWFWTSASFGHIQQMCIQDGYRSLFRFHYKPALRNVRWSNTLNHQRLKFKHWKPYISNPPVRQQVSDYCSVWPCQPALLHDDEGANRRQAHWRCSTRSILVLLKYHFTIEHYPE